MNLIVTLIGIKCIGLLIINYILPYILILSSKDQDFKKKYGKWALVTGSSSGIGKSIAHRLASQGISIILVAKDDQFFDEMLNEIKLKYKSINFLPIKLDLTKPESIKDLINKLKEFESNKILKINDIRILFNNAGYFVMEGFNQTSYDNDKLKMIQCNTLTSVELTDYFYRIWVENKNKNKNKNENNIDKRKNGLIIFTSSVAAVFPSPYSVIYSSCKSFLSSFASSLALEAKLNDVDILAVQPGRVETRIFDNVPNLLTLRIMKLFSQKPDQVVDIMFRSAGRYGIVNFNSGFFAILSCLIFNIFGPNLTNKIVYLLSKYIFTDYYSHCGKINK
ncbi:hypothetical protein RB653_001279 [Dictyostelium firmibasis]|uniref:Uncharacterized protein n=1 Tax=Dictyostelium firmibasis TaxID=79012 RepID=A0AAN7U744_9MYCE